MLSAKEFGGEICVWNSCVLCNASDLATYKYRGDCENMAPSLVANLISPSSYFPFFKLFFMLKEHDQRN